MRPSSRERTPATHALFKEERPLAATAPATELQQRRERTPATHGLFKEERPLKEDTYILV
jgi:hypothetical protein